MKVFESKPIPRILIVGVLATVVSCAVVVSPSLATQRVIQVTPVPYVPPAGSIAFGVTGCPDQNGCVWGQANYDGQRNAFDSDAAGEWHPLSGFNRNSAKNRFDSRKFKLGRMSGSGVTVISCLDPGDNRPDPGYFDEFFISDVTSDGCG